MNRLIVLMIVCVLFGCGPSTSQISRTLNATKGHHISEILKATGPPHQITSDGLNGNIYIWTGKETIRLANASKKTEKTIRPSFLGGYDIESKTVYKPPIVINRNQALMLWVDKDGFIYHWKTKGIGTSLDEQILIGIGVTITVIAYVLKYREDQKRAKRLRDALGY